MKLNAIASIAMRAIPGAYILNSGIGKVGMDEGTAEYLYNEAVKGLPFLESLDPKTFGKLLTAGEIGLGWALPLPFVPNKLAGLGLAAFSGGMMSMYFRDPANTLEDGIRPSQQGGALAKDSWMLAIALGLIFAKSSRSDKKKLAKVEAREAAKEAKIAAKDAKAAAKSAIAAKKSNKAKA